MQHAACLVIGGFRANLKWKYHICAAAVKYQLTSQSDVKTFRQDVDSWIFNAQLFSIIN